MLPIHFVKEHFEVQFLNLHATYYSYRSVHLETCVVTGNTYVEE